MTDRSIIRFPSRATGLLQCNALACFLEAEPEPVQSVHPTLVLGAVVVCKRRRY